MQRLFYYSILKLNNIEFNPKKIITPLSIDDKLNFEKHFLKKQTTN